VVVFVGRRSPSLIGARLRSRAVGFVCERLFSFVGGCLRLRAVVFVWGAVMVARRSWVVVRVGCCDVLDVGGVVGLLLWCDVALPRCCCCWGLHWWLAAVERCLREVVVVDREVGGRRGWCWLRSKNIVC
jgi:hypothetical protein